MRLRHTPRGFRRYMQVSNHQLFTFIEGKEGDGYFYGRLCESVCSGSGHSYEQVVASQLPGASTGGKRVLLTFFRYLRRAHFLVNDLQGKRTSVAFFLDKDIDDLERSRLRSRHVIYTEYYEVENYFYKHGDLANAAAAVASVDKRSLETGLGDLEVWRRSRAGLWSDWVVACVFCKTRGIRNQSNYRLTSRLNSPALSPTDAAKLATTIANIEADSGLLHDKFLTAYRRTTELVARLYASGNHDLVFRGKWYGVLMDAELRTILAARPYNDQRLALRLASALPLTLDYDGQWAAPLKQAIRAAL